MVTLHCTYPDGATSEARYALNLRTALELHDPLFDADSRFPDEDPDTLVDAEEDWDGPTLGGEG